MSLSLSDQFPKGTVVAYEPGYLNENGEPVQEIGIVSSCSWDHKYVFIKFKRDLDHFDGDWDAVTAKACKPDSLVKIIQQGETHENMAPK